MALTKFFLPLYGKSSIHPSVSDVEVSWSHRLEYF